MSDTHPQPATPREVRKPRAYVGVLVGLAMVVVALIVLTGRQQPSLAATPKVDIVYISVTEEGPSARAWFDGAPSPGVPVQDALNRFAKQGYQVAAVSEDLRNEINSFVILLQRVN